jgi:DNA-binding transcriptional LysR family regulator
MMDRIDDLEAFLAVVDEGGLTAAGRRLGRSLQSISRSLATLEQSIGVELVQRTTRLSQPTEAGQAFYHRIKPALQELNEARLEAATRRSEPSGVLRIGASVLFGPAFLVPVIARFMERHPQIRVELKLSDRFVDLTDEGLDFAVRIGHLPDSSLKARRLGELRRVFFGSPEYFDKHGRPEHPHDLSRHQCVVRSSDQQGGAWPVLIDGKPGTVRVNGRFRADDTASTYAAVAQGLGIGFTPLWQIRDLVDRGVVELVLVPFEPPTVPIHAVWHGSKLTPAKTRLFIDFLAGELECDRL